MAQITSIIFISVMAAAMATDLRTNRIPNALIGVGLTLALLLQSANGLAGLGIGLAGAALALLLTLPLFALGAIGAGDSKLFAVVGAFMGPEGFLLALLASAAVGGILGVGAAIRRGVILPVLIGCKDLVVHAVTLGRHGARTTLDTPGAVTIPYGAAIAVGSVATWFIMFSGL